ncbi:MAG: DNA repair protein RadA [Alphaproteobacteria bacterium]|nr:DNA repair protein RadA [Alphaproteobacteria bacterium]
MARAAARHVCQSCGAAFPKWSGRCEACGAWNSIVEEAPREAAPKGLGGAAKAGGRKLEFVGLTGETGGPPRLVTGMAEFDRVCGGGLVAGSALLLGGDPGIGKSTLLLQAAARIARQAPCVYISGEEAIDQVRMRAERLGVADAPVQLASATSVRDIVASLDSADRPAVAVVDSIQTMYVDTLDSAPGTVAQVRASAQELIRLAKRRGLAVILVGHVTKEGLIAGPRVLEHMVDTVLYFEGERGHQFRILRAVKNRFGPTDEIGVFEMGESGLGEVSNPSALFLGEHSTEVAGAAVFAGIEGTRPLLVEIQALVAPSPLGTPRRAVVGWDAARLAQVLAVLEARGGLAFAGNEVYLNVAGGLRIAEPAADLAVAAALVSSLTERPMPQATVVFGEIGLSGEIRPVGHVATRLKEAAKLGFAEAWVPRSRASGRSQAKSAGAGELGIKVRELEHVRDLVIAFQDQVRTGQFVPVRRGGAPAGP